MPVIENISEKVKSLLENDHFNVDTLAKYLGLSPEQVSDAANGKVDCLLGNHAAIDKIMFLYMIGLEEADLKASAFLQVLLSYHHLSPLTVAKMAGVGVGDVEKMAAGSLAGIDAASKYQIAVTAMALRFFLKDCEPPVDG